MDISNINTTLSLSQLQELEDVITEEKTDVEDEEFQKLVESINQRAEKLETAYKDSKDSIFSSLNFMQIAYDHTLREYEITGIIRTDETKENGSTSDVNSSSPPSNKVETENNTSKPIENTDAATSTQSTKKTYGIDGVPSSSHLTNTKYDSIIEQMSEKYEVPFDLIKLVINTESSFNPSAVSSSGAQGLMQLMPSTAKWLGVKNSMNPTQNIEGGTKYLSYLLDKYDNNLTLAVAAYNAGPGNVDKYGGVPPFKETQNYVKKILGK